MSYRDEEMRSQRMSHIPAHARKEMEAEALRVGKEVLKRIESSPGKSGTFKMKQRGSKIEFDFIANLSYKSKAYSRARATLVRIKMAQPNIRGEPCPCCGGTGRVERNDPKQ